MKTIKLVLVSDSKPKNLNEKRCSEMANKLELEYINPILALYYRYGMDVLEQAYEDITRKICSGVSIYNRGAYLWRTAQYISGELDKAEYFRDEYYS